MPNRRVMSGIDDFAGGCWLYLLKLASDTIVILSLVEYQP